MARDKLVNCNLKLVFNLVKRFQNRGYELEDLFQIGCIGLMKAIDKFDLNYDVKFSTYAVPMIVGEIRRFLRDDNPVKVSRSVKELAYKIQQIRDISRHGWAGNHPWGDRCRTLPEPGGGGECPGSCPGAHFNL